MRLDGANVPMMETKRTLRDQVAIVTGAARGIGRGIAARLAQEGAAVVVWDRDADAFDVAGAGFTPAAVVKVDVADFSSVERGMAATMERTGRLDILVNNAGVNGPVAPVWEYPLDAWDRVLAVDLTGVFHCCRVAVPAMRAAGYGRIVNVSSITGKEGSPGIAAYASAKAGVIGFTKSLARELVGVLPLALRHDDAADLGRDREAGGHREAERRHLGEVGPLAAEQRLVGGAALRGATAELLDVFHEAPPS